MTRIGAAFDRARREGRCALVPFVVAGDPDLRATRAILAALVAAGADVIELGIPYSDPLADGPAIVAAGQRALDAGATFDAALDCVTDVPVPVVVFTYANPVLQYGAARLGARLRDVGAAGLIVPDIPLEESLAVAVEMRAYGVEMPLLVAPTTAPERADRIVAASAGFVYLVSRLGVTGAGADQRPDPTRLQAHVARLRAATSLPIAVGFGLSQPEQVAAIAAFADGAIVGSALVEAIAAGPAAQAPDRAAAFLAPLVAAGRRAA